MKRRQLLLCLLIFAINNLNQAQSEDLLELSCLNANQCMQFEHTGIKADCIYDRCHCSSTSGEHIKCKPVSHKLGNIVGSPCPCQIPNSECDTKQDVCYCSRDYVPSTDRRRCIKKKTELGEHCELDIQCQKSDYNAICHKDLKVCMCMDLFVNETGKCLSVVDPKFVCFNETQCTTKFGNNTKCHNNSECICSSDYVASLDNSHCQDVAEYLGNCTTDRQCISTMGPGAKCKEKTCQCDDKYFPEQHKTSINGTLKTICSPIVERGQYCRFSEDCYQRQLSNETEQSMDCMYGECNCKIGFVVYNDGQCTYGGGSTKSLPLWITVVLLALAIVIFKFRFSCI
uniref:Putative multiple epidermal growth factor-like protein 10 n=1 Tax=Haematobia irritans TaxID=7368 RepID=A0A1L8EFN6_HAEIR